MEGAVARRPPPLHNFQEQYFSAVEVEFELVWVWPQPHWVHLIRALQADPSLNEVLGEYVTCGEVIVVCLQRIQRLRQGCRNLLNQGVALVAQCD